MPRRILALGVAAVAFGLLAQQLVYPWTQVARWLPDLAVGWTLAGGGLAVVWKRRGNLVGPLLLSAGFLWFLPSLAVIDAGLTWVGAHTLAWHRGPLVHALLSFPDGRLSLPVDRAVVVASYLVVVAPALARNDIAVATMGVFLVVAASRGVRRSVGSERRARRSVLPAALGFGGVLLGGALARGALSGSRVDEAVLAAYQLVLVGASISVAVQLLRTSWEKAAVTDLVIALSEAPSDSLRGALARALGDPTLRVGFRTTEGGYVDESGHPIEVPDASEHLVTRVPLEAGGEAVLLHDHAVLGDPGLLESVAAATRLAAANARLQGEVRLRIRQVRESRRRLVQAADRERASLERRMWEGGGRHLGAVSTALARARRRAVELGSDDSTARIDQAQQRLESTRGDLVALSRGLHPGVLEERGMVAALSELAGVCPVPTELTVSLSRLQPALTAAIYFVCAEALTNVAKHARASGCWITVEETGRVVRLEISDDGVGGASLAQGSGLRGLADRVEALGGRLVVCERSGGGTRLTAEIPLDGETS